MNEFAQKIQLMRAHGYSDEQIIDFLRSKGIHVSDLNEIVGEQGSQVQHEPQVPQTQQSEQFVQQTTPQIPQPSQYVQTPVQVTQPVMPAPQPQPQPVMSTPQYPQAPQEQHYGYGSQVSQQIPPQPVMYPQTRDVYGQQVYSPPAYNQSTGQTQIIKSKAPAYPSLMYGQAPVPRAKDPYLEPLTPDMHSGRKFINLVPSRGELVLPIRGERVLKTVEESKLEDDMKEKAQKLQEVMDDLKSTKGYKQMQKDMIRQQQESAQAAAKPSKFDPLQMAQEYNRAHAAQIVRTGVPSSEQPNMNKDTIDSGTKDTLSQKAPEPAVQDKTVIQEVAQQVQVPVSQNASQKVQPTPQSQPQIPENVRDLDKELEEKIKEVQESLEKGESKLKEARDNMNVPQPRPTTQAFEPVQQIPQSLVQPQASTPQPQSEPLPKVPQSVTPPVEQHQPSRPTERDHMMDQFKKESADLDREIEKVKSSIQGGQLSQDIESKRQELQKAVDQKPQESSDYSALLKQIRELRAKVPAAGKKEDKPSVPDAKQADIQPLTNKPNVISGVIKDASGRVLDSLLLIIKNERGDPVRAIKTNAIGQFILSTPLANGIYTLEVNSTNPDVGTFDIISVELKGEPVFPIEIQGRKA